MDARDSLDSVYVAVKVYRPRGRELAIADPLGTGRDGTGVEWGWDGMEGLIQIMSGIRLALICLTGRADEIGYTE